MKGALPFHKLSGAGNDFVLLYDQEAKAAHLSLSELARALCDRRRGVGADGLLVVGRARAKDAITLAYLNSDGSRAFCANGTRCAVWWSHWAGLVHGDHIRIEAGRERLEARIEGPGNVRVRMPDVRRIRLGLTVPMEGKALTVHSLDTGVPHAVLFVKDAGRIPVETLGPELRYHPVFRPAGTNVDFATLIEETPVRSKAGGALAVRTYERGVEAETLACGTGVTASAVAACLLGKARPPVACRTRGGDTLKVYFAVSGKSVRDVWLEGPARVTFKGVYYV